MGRDIVNRLLRGLAAPARRVWLLAAIVLALAVPVAVLAAQLPSGAANAPAFEVDGDALADDSGDGSLDWDDALAGGEADEGVIDAVRNRDGTCTQSGAPVLGRPGHKGTGVLVCDGSVGGFSDQNVFESDKEDEGTNPVLWGIHPAPPSVPKKADLSEVSVYTASGDSAFDDDDGAERDDDLFVSFAMTRLDVNGDTHADFEFNQKPVSEPGSEGCDAGATTFCQVRTEGDVIVAFDVASAASGPQVRVFTFREKLEPADQCADQQAAVPPGCYVGLPSPVGPNGEPATAGLLNATEVAAPSWGTVGCEPVTGDRKPGCRTRARIPAGGQMEGYVDLTALLGGDYAVCPGFVQVTPKTRASDSLGASLKDTTAPIAIRAEQCGSLLIGAVDGDGAAVGGGAFQFDPDPLTPEPGTNRIVADGSEDDHGPGAGLVCIDGVQFGSYDVTQSTAPPGHWGDDDTETAVRVTASTCAERLAASAPAVDAQFENPQGSFLIRKDDENGKRVGGATFVIRNDPATGEPGSSVTIRDADRDGVVCVDHVFIRNDAPTDYDVEETVAPKGYVVDDAIHVVTVSAPGTCAGESASNPDVIVVNRKGGKP